MRRHQQREILNTLQSIEQTQQVCNYAACQEITLSLCDYVEDVVGKDTRTVELLLKHCEFLFKAFNGEISAKILQNHLRKIENSVQTELRPTRTEMVFLSYKASMSDSIESVYFAAKSDPNCDAYWIPIPYYEKNPDDSIGPMQYEGANYYSENIEITDWQTYDIESRRPDIIFTFSPYDNANLVTTIHPNFYCERLRNLASLLVYVPYFVAAGTVQEHFCILPGCIYAHKVVLQSDEIRDIYTRVFKERFGNQYGKPEEKFVSLGSPKLDNVVNSKRSDFTLPDAWGRITGNKKIVLYNTTIAAIISGEAQYLKKLRYVLESFLNQDEIILWWRPHPLIEETLQSMRPALLHEYKKIVDSYKSSGRGIFDDTPELHRAIALADAYYGDHSSLVVIFQCTGKPIIIQNIEDTNGIQLRFATFARDSSNDFWGFDLFEDGLFKFDFSNNIARYMMRSECIPTWQGVEYLRMTHRFIGIQCVGNQVICFPHFQNSILVYDTAAKTKKIIPLDASLKLSQETDGFALMYTVKHKNYIYCFGRFSKTVVVFDAESHVVRYDTALFEQIGIETKTGRFVKYPLYISDCSEDGKIIMLMRDCEHLIQYTLPTQKVEYIKSNPILAQCTLAEFDGKFYWLLSESNNKLIKWEPVSNETMEYHMSVVGFDFSDKLNTFYGVTDCGSYLLLFPGWGDIFLKFDKETESFSEYSELPIIKDNEIIKYERPQRIGDKIYVFARYIGTVYILDTLSGKITSHKFRMDNESHEAFIKDLYNSEQSSEIFDGLQNGIYEANFGNTANVFSVILSGSQRDKATIYGATGTAGTDIYNYINKVMT